MFKDVKNPQLDEIFTFAVSVIVTVFLVVIIAVSYEITRIL